MPTIRFSCPHCKQSIEKPIEMLGQLMECPSCYETIEVQKQRAPKLPPPPRPHSLHRSVPKLKIPRPPRKQGKIFKGKVYKVLTPRDQWFEGNYDPEKWEAAINFYAAKGWFVISVVATGPQQEIRVVMGKNK